MRQPSPHLHIFYTVECVKSPQTGSRERFLPIAALAQLVEQLLRKEKVDSSIPSSGTTHMSKARITRAFFCARFPTMLETNADHNRRTIYGDDLYIWQTLPPCIC